MGNTHSSEGFRKEDLLPGPRVPDPPLPRPPSPPPQPAVELEPPPSPRRVSEDATEFDSSNLSEAKESETLATVPDVDTEDAAVVDEKKENLEKPRHRVPQSFECCDLARALEVVGIKENSTERSTKSAILDIATKITSRGSISGSSKSLLGAIFTVCKTYSTFLQPVLESVLTTEALGHLELCNCAPLPSNYLTSLSSSEWRLETDPSRMMTYEMASEAYTVLKLSASALPDEVWRAYRTMCAAFRTRSRAMKAMLTLSLARKNGLTASSGAEALTYVLTLYLRFVLQVVPDSEELVSCASAALADLGTDPFAGTFGQDLVHDMQKELNRLSREQKDLANSMNGDKLRLRRLEASPRDPPIATNDEEHESRVQTLRQAIKELKKLLQDQPLADKDISESNEGVLPIATNESKAQALWDAKDRHVRAIEGLESSKERWKELGKQVEGAEASRHAHSDDNSASTLPTTASVSLVTPVALPSRSGPAEFVIRRLSTQVRALSCQLRDKNVEIGELLARLAEMEGL